MPGDKSRAPRGRTAGARRVYNKAFLPSSHGVPTEGEIYIKKAWYCVAHTVWDWLFSGVPCLNWWACVFLLVYFCCFGYSFIPTKSLSKNQSTINKSQSPIINEQWMTHRHSPIINEQWMTHRHSPITNFLSPIPTHQSPITNPQEPLTSHQSPIINHQRQLYTHDQ